MERMEKFVHQRVETHSIVLGSMLLALVLIAALVFWRNRRAQSGDTILLVGPSDGGKTAIFSSLVYNHAPQTHTSLQQNTALFRSPSLFHRRPLRIVDIPGHPRIRGQFAEYLLGTSTSTSSSKKGDVKLGGVKAIVFVCDAAALTRNASTVAEHLHLIMSAIANLPPSIPPPPLLVFANKSDLLPKAAAAAAAATSTGTGTSTPTGRGGKPTINSGLALSRTQTILERELDKRRIAALSRSGGGGASSGVLSELGADGDVDEGTTALGGLDVVGEEEDEVFSFAKWEGGEVELRSGWVDVKKRGGGGVNAGKGVETDSEGEGEGEEKVDSRVRGSADASVAKEGRSDGLVQLVEWIAALR